jgi:hypothetical protein
LCLKFPITKTLFSQLNKEFKTFGTHNDIFGPGGGFFTLSDRLIYEGPKRQVEVMNELQKIAIEKTKLGIPLLEIEEGTHGLMCFDRTFQTNDR